jgi:N-acyl-L-homoserine lactone synthetase
MGWRCETLGSPRRYDGPSLGAFVIDIDDDTPERLAQKGIYTAGAMTALWEQDQ